MMKLGIVLLSNLKKSFFLMTILKNPHQYKIEVNKYEKEKSTITRATRQHIEIPFFGQFINMFYCGVMDYYLD